MAAWPSRALSHSQSDLSWCHAHSTHSPACGSGENTVQFCDHELQGAGSECMVTSGRRVKRRATTGSSSAPLTVSPSRSVRLGVSARGEKVGRSSHSDHDVASAFSVHRRVVSCPDQLTPLHTSPACASPFVSLSVLVSLLPVLLLPVLVVVASIRVRNTVGSKMKE